MKGGRIRRFAVMRPGEIVAECPIGCVCTSKIENSKEWRRCGHYDGTIRDRKGLQAICLFNEERRKYA